MKLIMRKASARWESGARGGTQTLSAESGALKQIRYSLGIPFENSATDPAELVAAAHAASFALALSHELGLARSVSGNIVVTATVTLEHVAAGWTILDLHLNIVARLPGVPQGRFIDATVRAKTSCMVSRLLRANISMTAKLEKVKALAWRRPSRAAGARAAKSAAQFFQRR